MLEFLPERKVCVMVGVRGSYFISLLQCPTNNYSPNNSIVGAEEGT